MNLPKIPLGFVMVGAPGSGKSTAAKTIAYNNNCHLISGDDIREEIYGDASVPGDWPEVADRQEEILSECCGMNVILDEPHHKRQYRGESISLLKSFGYNHIIAIVLHPTLETCLSRNASRKRVVPEHVVSKMHKSIAGSMYSIFMEGFQQVFFMDLTGVEG